MQLVLQSIRMNKDNAKAVRLESFTLDQDLAYKLVFTKHINNKEAEVREDLL